MTFPSTATWPSLATWPSGVGSGNPTGINESVFLARSDTSRPDTLRWLAVSLLTGSVVCELPSLTTSSPYRRTLNQYESQSVDLYVTDKISPSWRDGTRPFAAALIGFRGAPGSEVVQWGGVVLRRQRRHGSNKVTLTLATPECYLDRRNTGAYTTDPTGVGATRDQNTIVSDLVANFAAASSGLPIAVTVVGGAGTQRLATYNDYDDKTVYSNLGELAGLVNGPEWTGHWSWDHGTGLITPVLYVGNRIGTPTPAGLVPSVVFDSSNLISADLDENYTTGYGANDVTATSSGQGLARPQANSVAPSFNGRPRVQFRFQPSTSIQDPLTLQQHATQARSLLSEGTNTVKLVASASAKGVQLGVDWNIGDDLGYQLDGPSFPGGWSGTARCIGYEADTTTITPVLYAPTVN